MTAVAAAVVKHVNQSAATALCASPGQMATPVGVVSNVLLLLLLQAFSIFHNSRHCVACLTWEDGHSCWRCFKCLAAAAAAGVIHKV
jgi:hypothetical protein